MPPFPRFRNRSARSVPKIKKNHKYATRLESFAHIATISSSVVAALTILASAFQFREAMQLQHQSVELQVRALQMERSSKAYELFQKFLEVRYEPLPKAQEARNNALVARNNHALLLLNTLYETTKDDKQWETIISDSLYYFERFMHDRNVRCLRLTKDFQAFMLKTLPNAPADSWKMCRDLNDSE